MKKAVLFDLDGTLLPMDQEKFVQAYFGGLCRKLAPLGYDKDSLVKAIWASTKQMILNTSEHTNEEVFWECFRQILGDRVMNDIEVFRNFYLNEFKGVQSSCGYNERAYEIIELCRSLGLRTILATNPIFPKEATFERMSWAGIRQEQFELITTYENCTSTKPSPRYYEEILEKRGLKPEETVMIGNDAAEDGIAATLGIEVFLLTDDLINTKGIDISGFAQGGYDELESFIRSLNT